MAGWRSRVAANGTTALGLNTAEQPDRLLGPSPALSHICWRRHCNLSKSRPSTHNLFYSLLSDEGGRRGAPNGILEGGSTIRRPDSYLVGALHSEQLMHTSEGQHGPPFGGLRVSEDTMQDLAFHGYRAYAASPFLKEERNGVEIPVWWAWHWAHQRVIEAGFSRIPATTGTSRRHQARPRRARAGGHRAMLPRPASRRETWRTSWGPRPSGSAPSRSRSDRILTAGASGSPARLGPVPSKL